MLIERTPPRRISPAITTGPDPASPPSFSSNASFQNHRKIGHLPSQSQPSNLLTTPLQDHHQQPRSSSLYPPLPPSSSESSHDRRLFASNPDDRPMRPARQSLESIGFPSLEEMARPIREAREQSSASSSSIPTSKPSASTTTSFGPQAIKTNRQPPPPRHQVPSSLPRPERNRSESLYPKLTGAKARASLTAMESARLEVGDETPTAVSAAKAQRASKLSRSEEASRRGSLVGRGRQHDLVPGGYRDDQVVNLIQDDSDDEDGGQNAIVHMEIDIEGGKVMAHQTLASKARSASEGESLIQTRVENKGDPIEIGCIRDVDEVDDDVEDEGGETIFNDRDERPIGGRPAAYDISAYIRDGVDPFKKKRIREDDELPPPPPPPSHHSHFQIQNRPSEDSDRGRQRTPENHDGGDGYGSQAPTPKAFAHIPPATAPSGKNLSGKADQASSSMQPPSQVPRPNSKGSGSLNGSASATFPANGKPASVITSTQEFTPKGTPQSLASRRPNQRTGLRDLSQGAAAASGDTSTSSNIGPPSASKKYDPSARADRILSLEMADLRKKNASLSDDLKNLNQRLSSQEQARLSALEEMEGWKSECTALEGLLEESRSEREKLTSNHESELAQSDTRLKEAKWRMEDKAWRNLTDDLTGESALTSLAIELVISKNEATYQRYRGEESQEDLETLRETSKLRLLAERKRSELLCQRLKATMKEKSRLGDVVSRLEGKNSILREQISSVKKSMEKGLIESQDAVREEVEALENELGMERKENERMRKENEKLKKRDEDFKEVLSDLKKEKKELVTMIKELELELAEMKKPSSKTNSTARHPKASVGRAARRREVGRDLDQDKDDAIEVDSLDEQEEETQISIPPSSPPLKSSNLGRHAGGLGLIKQVYRGPMQGASEAGPSEADIPIPSSPSPKARSQKKPNRSADASVPSRGNTKASSKLAKSSLTSSFRRRSSVGGEGSDFEQKGTAVEQEQEEEEEEKEEEEEEEKEDIHLRDRTNTKLALRPKAAPTKARTKRKAIGREEDSESEGYQQEKKNMSKKRSNANSSSSSAAVAARKARNLAKAKSEAQLAAANELLADVGATPMISRRVKDAFEKEEKARLEAGDGNSDDEEGRGGATKKGADGAGAEVQVQRKKKRKLLGAKNDQPGLFNWGSNVEGVSSLAPELDIPMALSPIKPQNGNVAAFGGLGSAFGTRRLFG
ncbi:hypothetical protein IE53DRAFT_384334 [Violaceomyces palustris]|uniref:Uncharacterized protein n=1 Tax=Violaceomyces palustris TaxID=1673888 RepID=A0ACD0P586_9BASI|nr:hypothetical protein IE53DRAFT_384334 [Violaceomyces palustris]